MESEMTFETELDALRAEIAGVQDEIVWTTDAPLPKDEVKQRLAQAGKTQAEKFNLNLARLANPQAGEQELREIMSLQEQVVVHAAPGVVGVRIDLSGALFALFGEDLVKRLGKQVDALDYVAGPPAKDRPARLAALREALRDLERKEENRIMHAEACGVILARRPDADPAIVLDYDPTGLLDELPLPGRAPAGPLRGPVAKIG